MNYTFMRCIIGAFALAIAYSWNILIAGALLAIIAAVALELMH